MNLSKIFKTFEPFRKKTLNILFLAYVYKSIALVNEL